MFAGQQDGFGYEGPVAAYWNHQPADVGTPFPATAPAYQTTRNDNDIACGSCQQIYFDAEDDNSTCTSSDDGEPINSLNIQLDQKSTDGQVWEAVWLTKKFRRRRSGRSPRRHRFGREAKGRGRSRSVGSGGGHKRFRKSGWSFLG